MSVASMSTNDATLATKSMSSPNGTPTGLRDGRRATFGSLPLKAAMVFFAAYLLGIVTALFTAYCLKRRYQKRRTGHPTR